MLITACIGGVDRLRLHIGDNRSVYGRSLNTLRICSLLLLVGSVFRLLFRLLIIRIHSLHFIIALLWVSYCRYLVVAWVLADIQGHFALVMHLEEAVNMIHLMVVPLLLVLRDPFRSRHGRVILLGRKLLLPLRNFFIFRFLILTLPFALFLALFNICALSLVHKQAHHRS